MADKKISALTPLATPLATDKIAVESGGNSYSITREQSHTLGSTERIQASADQEVGTTVGSDTERLGSVHARLGVFVGSSDAATTALDNPAGTRTFATNAPGIMAGNQTEDSTGTATLELGVYYGHRRAAACIGNAESEGAGNASLKSMSRGSAVFGYAVAYGTGNATVEDTWYGGFTIAGVRANGSANHSATNYGSGNLMIASTGGAGAATAITFGSASINNVNQVSRAASGSTRSTAYNHGTFAMGAALTNVGAGAQYAHVNAHGGGSMVMGYAVATVADITAKLSGLGKGSFAGGYAKGANITAGVSQSSGHGAFARGYAVGTGSNIIATAEGSFAHGHATAGYAITASASGAFAVGASAAGAIVASATNAVQFGPGTNNLADSFQVGNAGLRFKGTTGAPGAPTDGDLWVASGYVYIRSNGTTRKIDGSDI